MEEKYKVYFSMQGRKCFPAKLLNVRQALRIVNDAEMHEYSYEIYEYFNSRNIGKITKEELEIKIAEI